MLLQAAGMKVHRGSCVIITQCVIIGFYVCHYYTFEYTAGYRDQDGQERQVPGGEREGHGRRQAVVRDSSSRTRRTACCGVSASAW